MSFPACRGPALLPVCGDVQTAPFCDCRRLAFVPGHDIDLVDLDLVCQPHRGSLGDQAVAQLLGHGLHVGSVEAQFLGDLTAREVQAHEVHAHRTHTVRAAGSRGPWIGGVHRYRSGLSPSGAPILGGPRSACWFAPDGWLS